MLTKMLPVEDRSWQANWPGAVLFITVGLLFMAMAAMLQWQWQSQSREALVRAVGQAQIGPEKWGSVYFVLEGPGMHLTYPSRFGHVGRVRSALSEAGTVPVKVLYDPAHRNERDGILYFTVRELSVGNEVIVSAAEINEKVAWEHKAGAAMGAGFTLYGVYRAILLLRRRRRAGW